MSDKIIVAVDSQWLNDIDACAQKAKFAKLDHWELRRKGDALELGIVLHDVLAHYYRGVAVGKHREDFPKFVEECLAVGRERIVDTNLEISKFDDIHRTFTEYCIYYKADGWRPLEVEQAFSKVLYEDSKLLIIYEGIIDLVVDVPNIGPIVVDHKSSSKHTDPSAMSNQFKGYCWATNQRQILINKIGFQKTVAPREKFTRPIKKYPKGVLSEWTTDAVHHIKQFVNYTAIDYFPKRRTSCDKYGGCIFQEICLTEPAARQLRLNSSFVKGKPWSVYTRDEKTRSQISQD